MSSKRRLRRKSCKGKRPYETLHQAALAARVLQRGARAGEHITPYRCRFCGRHHIGHTPGRNNTFR